MSEENSKDINNRFELVLLAIGRAKSLMAGAQSLVDAPDKTKKTVIALEEIEKGLLNIEQIKINLEKELRNNVLYKRMGDIDYGSEGDTGSKEDLSEDLEIDEEDDLLDDDLNELDEEDDIVIDDSIPLDEDDEKY